MKARRSRCLSLKRSPCVFPWLCAEGLGAGSLGLSGEGWFDAHTLLRALRAGARDAGAVLIDADVAGITLSAARFAD
jgi:hypothetical protein